MGITFALLAARASGTGPAQVYPTPDTSSNGVRVIYAPDARGPLPPAVTVATSPLPPSFANTSVSPSALLGNPPPNPASSGPVPPNAPGVQSAGTGNAVAAGGGPGAQNVTAAAANARGVPSLAATTNTGAPGSATGPLLAGTTSSASSSGGSTNRLIPNLPAGPNGARLVQLVQSQLGARYTWAGVSPTTGFDCSGFVYWAYNTIGYNLPRTMEDQFASGRRVSMDQLRPGDIVFFSDTYTPGLSHDGIFIGDGKFIHAVDESTGVAVTSLDSAYWRERYSGAVHIMD